MDYSCVQTSNEKKKHKSKKSYLEHATLPKKSSQDMSPVRNSQLKVDPLAGMTIARGALASMTLLQNRFHFSRRYQIQ